METGGKDFEVEIVWTKVASDKLLLLMECEQGILSSIYKLSVFQRTNATDMTETHL